MDVRWTEKASADALGIFDYIADQSLAYAESVYERILERPVQLTDPPRPYRNTVEDLVWARNA